MSQLRGLMNRYLGTDVLAAELGEPESAAADAHFNELLQRILPILAAFGVATTVVLWPFDYLIAQPRPGQMAAFTAFRVFSLLVCVLLIVSLRYIPVLRARPLPVAIVLLSALGMGSGWVLGGVFNLAEPVFWVWMMMGYMVVAMPMRLRARIVAHGGILGGFTVTFLIRQHGEPASESNFGVAVAMAFATLFLSISMGNLVSSLMRRSFRQKREIERARAESERLLSNVLPEAVAQRLKAARDVIADRFETSTVMFADLVGFTELAKSQDAAELVALLNEIFSAFDKLTEARELEKIKTIGDAYMVVGGVPVAHPDHVAAVCDLALAMMAEVEVLSEQHGRRLRLRIGIHSGPVVAGVIGSHKLSYDVWGDTVNTASRMESHGLPDTIHVTGAVREAMDGRYVFEERGGIEVKGKGLMQTWFLRRAALQS